MREQVTSKEQSATFEISYERGWVSIATGILLVTIMALPARVWVPFGPFASFSIADVALIGGLLVLVLHYLYRAKIPIGSRAVVAALVLPIVSCYSSFLWSEDLVATFKAALIYTEALVAYLLAICVFRHFHFDTIARLMSLFIFVLMLGAVLSYLDIPLFRPQVPPDLSESERLAYVLSYHARFSHPFLGLSNNLATVLVFFPFVLTLCARLTKSQFYFWASALSVIAIFATFSRGVIAALCVGYAIYALADRFRSYRPLSFLMYILFVVLGVSLFIVMDNDAAIHLGDRLSLETIEVRWEYYKKAVEAIAEAPLLGHGAGVSAGATAGSGIFNVHNGFLEQLVYFGFIGGTPVILALVMLPLAIAGIPVISPAARTMRRAVALSVLVELLVFMSQASFEGSVLRVLFYFSIGIGVSLIWAAEKKSWRDGWT